MEKGTESNQHEQFRKLQFYVVKVVPPGIEPGSKV